MRHNARQSDNNRIAHLLITLSRSPWSELQRAQLNEVGPKELCCRLGARPLNTIHIMTSEHSTTARVSILRREETGVPGENPRSQVEID